jgi:hypothetical protein
MHFLERINGTWASSTIATTRHRRRHSFLVLVVALVAGSVSITTNNPRFFYNLLDNVSPLKKHAQEKPVLLVHKTAAAARGGGGGGVVDVQNGPDQANHSSSSNGHGKEGANGEMRAKEVVKTLDALKEGAGLVPLFFIPSSPSETNLTALEDSIVMLNETDASPLESCQPTAQVLILAATRTTADATRTVTTGAADPVLFWTLQTFDQHGRAKKVGGDELYDQVDTPTAVALVDDNGDGSYRLDFVTTPMKPNLATLAGGQLTGVGSLIVYFDYTCGIGIMAPPTKANWKSKGSTSVVHTKTGVIQPPNIRIFQHPPRPIPNSLSMFPMVYFIGASTMSHLVVNRSTKNNYRPKYTQMPSHVRYALTTQTADEFIQGGIHHPNETLNTGDRNALILGSDIWDILSNKANNPDAADHDNTNRSIISSHNHHGFDDHLKACAYVVERARMLYPNTTVMWK